MTRRGLISGSLLVCMTVVPPVVTPGLSGPIAAGTALATSEAPAQHCVNHGADTLAALRKGDKRAVVLVKSFQPAKPASAGLVVSLLTADKSKRHELKRFGVHPLRAFTAQEPPGSSAFPSRWRNMVSSSKTIGRSVSKWVSMRRAASRKADRRK